MISKQQVIEILELALSNPNYLADRNEKQESTAWFCCSVNQVLKEKYHQSLGDDIQEYVCDNYIYPSINKCLFLRTHLVNQGLIEFGTCYTDTVYKITARSHWQTLINKLKQS